jgi:hypothetical protein
MVAPAYVFDAVNVNVPLPDIVSVPFPDITPPSVCAALLLYVSAPLSVMPAEYVPLPSTPAPPMTSTDALLTDVFPP